MRKRNILKKSMLAIALSALPISFSMIPTNAAESEIQVIHTNDMHGYSEYNTKGTSTIGFAYLKAIVNKENPELILDAGDTYHGQAFATVAKGESMAKMMKSIGYDATTPGNHDWSYGSERLKELEKVQGFPVLAANVTDTAGKEYFETPYVTKEVTVNQTKVKIGVVGVIDDVFYNSTVQDNVKGLTFREEATAANETVKELRDNEKCDIVIAITHQADCKGFTKKLSGVDAVIAGHEHVLMDTRYEDADGKQIPVVEAGYYFNDVGVLSLTYDDEKDAITNATEKVYSAKDLVELTQVSDIIDQLNQIKKEEEPILNEVIGKSSKEYPYSWEEIRCDEQAIGRIITGAYLNKTGADVAMENAGGIRAGIPSGNITYQNIISISPYGNTLLTKKMTGKQILEVVEQTLSLREECDKVYKLQKEAIEKGEDPYQYSFPSDSGSVISFAGIKVTYDETKSSGHQIVSAKIKGVTVDPAKEYTVAMNNYVADSASYANLDKVNILKEYGTCEEALKLYIQTAKFEQEAEQKNLTKYVKPPVQPTKPTITKPTTPQGVKVETITSGKPKVSWKKIAKATGYKVYRSTKKNGTYKWMKTLTKNSIISWVDTKASIGTTYYYKVKAYTSGNGKTLYSGYSSKKAIKAIPATPTFKLKSKSGKIKVILTSKGKKSGWQVFKKYQTGKFHIINKHKIKGTVFTSMSGKKGKKYTYKIRVYQVVKGKKVYSKWTKQKIIRK